MIFDDFDDDELMCADKQPQAQPSLQDMEFETSLDGEMQVQQARRARRDHAAFYEVFQVQLNERFFLQSAARPADPAELSFRAPSHSATSRSSRHTGRLRPAEPLEMPRPFPLLLLRDSAAAWPPSFGSVRLTEEQIRSHAGIGLTSVLVKEEGGRLPPPAGMRRESFATESDSDDEDEDDDDEEEMEDGAVSAGREARQFGETSLQRDTSICFQQPKANTNTNQNLSQNQNSLGDFCQTTSQMQGRMRNRSQFHPQHQNHPQLHQSNHFGSQRASAFGLAADPNAQANANTLLMLPRDAKSISSFMLKKRNISAAFNSKSRNRTQRKAHRKRICDDPNQQLSQPVLQQQPSGAGLLHSICDLGGSRRGEHLGSEPFRRAKSVTNVTRECFRQLEVCGDGHSVESLISLENVEQARKRRMDVAGEQCRCGARDFGLKDIIARTLACLHVFHRDCLQAWVDGQFEAEAEVCCPQCRHVL